MTSAPVTPGRCARCGAAFHCGIADPQPCACTEVRVDAPTLARLRERYTGCLCVTCLAEFARAGTDVFAEGTGAARQSGP